MPLPTSPSIPPSPSRFRALPLTHLSVLAPSSPPHQVAYGEAKLANILLASPASASHPLPPLLFLPSPPHQVAYGESKLANILFAQELAQRLPLTADQRLTSLCVHPGVVSTSLFREFGAGGASFGAGRSSRDSPLSLAIKSPVEGCRTSVRVGRGQSGILWGKGWRR
jgi:NAD(P)-dependent dehydrogenase (short-subunit alcohol dehydrogenase family)